MLSRHLARGEPSLFNLKNTMFVHNNTLLWNNPPLQATPHLASLLRLLCLFSLFLLQSLLPARAPALGIQWQ